jgi:hypothetical protein
MMLLNANMRYILSSQNLDEGSMDRQVIWHHLRSDVGTRSRNVSVDVSISI